MKTKALCATALTAIIAASLIGGASASAETVQKSLAGKGTVEYVEDTDSNDKLDPEDGDKEVVPKDEEDVTENPSTGFGSITIDRVAALNFGQQKVSTKAEKYAAKEIALSQTDLDGTNPVDVVRGPFVQWTDKRAGADHTYAVKAELTKQFTLKGAAADPAKLDKATISFTNGVLNSSQNDLSYWPAGNPGNFTLGFGTDNTGAGQQLVFDNSASTGAVGLGTYVAEFGQSADFTADKVSRPGAPTTGVGQASNSVFLDVPAQTIEVGTYEAEITWSIEYTPVA
ncbi:WxL domain-containing protein [Enterococcus crotali]|uniref:WxL domain-containing protein n=1 Tax=Enterococcus crotali TaxID=1453587 RepID=UPI00047017CF|nr:WxL domain-containing protein [Enterococcus crotali]